MHSTQAFTELQNLHPLHLVDHADVLDRASIGLGSGGGHLVIVVPVVGGAMAEAVPAAEATEQQSVGLSA